jgi:dipeptidyl aminopeptidase/acylaminoacyl peptidase
MVAQIASETCLGCEVQAVVSFYGVYDFTPWAKNSEDRPALDRIFGKWDDDTLKRYSPLFHVRSDMPPILLIQGTNDDLHRGTLSYADRLKNAGVRHELIVLDRAPHGMENWAGHPEWDFYKKRMVDWLHAALE